MALTPEKILKGRIGECLVEELLKQCGNEVYRFGFEAVLQNLTQIEKHFDGESEVGQRIRSIPDFIVINKDKKPFLVEVKFRSKLEEFGAYENEKQMLERIRKFWKAKLIFLTIEKPYFRISENPYLDNDEKLIWIPLVDDRDLNVSQDCLAELNPIVENYLPKVSQGVEEKN
jgi:hypothetical protein